MVLSCRRSRLRYLVPDEGVGSSPSLAPRMPRSRPPRPLRTCAFSFKAATVARPKTRSQPTAGSPGPHVPAIPFCLANSALVFSSMKKWVFPPWSRVAPAANFGNEILATGSSTISALSNTSASWISMNRPTNDRIRSSSHLVSPCRVDVRDRGAELAVRVELPQDRHDLQVVLDHRPLDLLVRGDRERQDDVRLGRLELERRRPPRLGHGRGDLTRSPARFARASSRGLAVSTILGLGPLVLLEQSLPLLVAPGVAAASAAGPSP